MKSTKPTGTRKRDPKKGRRVLRDTASEYSILDASEEHIIRKNAFGLEESLDRKSYMEVLAGERELTALLEEYLDNAVPSRSRRKFKKVELKVEEKK